MGVIVVVGVVVGVVFVGVVVVVVKAGKKMAVPTFRANNCSHQAPALTWVFAPDGQTLQIYRYALQKRPPVTATKESLRGEKLLPPCWSSKQS